MTNTKKQMPEKIGFTQLKDDDYVFGIRQLNNKISGIIDFLTPQEEERCKHDVVIPDCFVCYPDQKEKVLVFGSPEEKQGWGERFERIALTEPDPNQALFNLPQLKGFISGLLSEEYDRGAMEATNVCNEKTIPQAVREERERVIGEIKKLKVIMWNDDSAQHIRNIQNNETVDKIVSVLTSKLDKGE